MMARPAADYLVHFGPQDGAEARNEIPSVDLCVDLLEEPPGDDPEATFLVARENGFAEGIASANGEWEAKLAQERQAFEMRLATERENWAREEGEKLAEMIQAALAEIESNIAGCVARILKPMTIEATRAKIVGLLAENVGVLLRGQKCPTLAIAGPEDLVTALREKLSPLSAEFEYSLNKSIDVRVNVGETLIESQLAAFAGRIETHEE